MIINKPLNNNVVMAYDDNKEEIIVVGTGIGFQAKVGDIINKSKVQQIFVLKDYDSKLIDLLEEIPLVFLEITELVVEYAKKEYDIQLHSKIYLLLTDHLYFAIERQKDGIFLENPFLYDIKHYCQREFQIALYAKEKIKEKVGIEIYEEEVGYIAMHIFEAVNNQDEKIFQHVFELINEVIAIIEEEIDIDSDENGLRYNRLKVHVNHFARRYLQDKEDTQGDDLLDDTIKQVFLEEFRCVEKIAAYLEGKYGRKMTGSEMNYLVLHIRNCKSK